MEFDSTKQKEKDALTMLHDNIKAFIMLDIM